mgnify:FL=1
MNNKIFKSSFLTTLFVLIATIALIMGVLFDFFEDQIQKEIENEAEYLAQAVENEGIQFFDSFDVNENRITLISADGTVIFDNQIDAASLDNHAEREEIKQAMETGSGMSTRYSKTLTEKTVYYALKLSDNNILRVSTDQYTVVTILLGMVQPLLIVLIIAFVLTIILSSRVSKAIIKPINELDLDCPENNETYEELTPLLKKISIQKQIITKQLSEAHQKQEEFNLITENMNEGFLVIDKNTNILTYNSAALKLLGVESTELKPVLSVCREKNFRDAVDLVLSGEKSVNMIERFGRTYRIIANPVFENDSVIGAVIIIIDVTEIEKGDEMRREFTANVSHELKTPLTSISGFAELMKNGDVAGETVVDFSKSIYCEAQRLISLVNDIIKISELDEGNFLAENERVDLYDLAGEIIERLKSEAAKKNISFSLIGSQAEVLGVPKILDEMLYNICDNAVKYNKENGTVDIIINQTDKKVNVIVRDTGIGIPQEHQQRVFERFYRVDKSHSKKVGGTGLGLAIVKHGAIYHNAEIKLESEENKGTTITLTFDKA